MKCLAFVRCYLVLFPMLGIVLGFRSVPCRADLWGISTDISYSRVIRFDPQTGAELPGGIPKGTDPPIPAPSGIATDANGRIYVSSRGDAGAGISPRILIYSCDQSGNCSPDTLPGGTPGVFADLGADPDPAQPSVLRFGQDGNLYVSELFGEKVRAYNPATGERLADVASGLPGSGGIAFESNGSLLVGTVAVPDFEIPATISRFNSGQQQSPFFVASQGELIFPASLLFLPNGDLLAVDLFADRIERFSGAGQDLGAFATIPTIITGKPSFPSDIVFDPNGNLIVSVLGPNNPGDPGGNQGELLRYDLNGNLIQTIATQLEQIGGLAFTSSPETLAGNYDGIGGVDSSDYAKWRADFGKWVAPGNGADGNGDGVVDAADYIVWRKGMAAAAGAVVDSAEGVPEPSTIALAVTALTAMIGISRRSLQV